ncbi:MAG: YqhA family protein [Acetobacteraceae bacterium]|nr:YqhA family protein [Acetobacteraceae bacterium]
MASGEHSAAARRNLAWRSHARGALTRERRRFGHEHEHRTRAHALAPRGGGAGPRSALVAAKGLQLATLVGIGSLLVAASTLLIYGAVETILQVLQLVHIEIYATANRNIFLSSIKLVDLLLLATFMQVIGIGLYSLLIGKRLPVPGWLMNADVDDLKNKLAGIVAVMLGVSFLEQMVYWGSERDLMRLGIGIAAVIAALSYFTRNPGR